MLRVRIVLGAASVWFLTLTLLTRAETGPEARSATVSQAEVELVPQIASPVTGGLAFSPDGRFVVVGCSDNTLKLWDIATGKLLRSFTGHTSPVRFAAFSPDGQFVMSGSHDAIKLWEPATGRELRSIAPKNRGTIETVAFSPDGRFAASGSTVFVRNSSTQKEVITLWDLATGQQVRTFEGHGYPVIAIAFSPDGRFILSGSGSRKSSPEPVKPASGETMKLWDVATGQEVRGLPVGGEGVDAVAFSPDGRLALSGGRDQTMRLWDLATGTELRSFRGITGHTRSTSKITSLAFSPDGRFALSGNSYDKRIAPDRRVGLTNAANTRLWDVNTGQEVRNFVVPSETIAEVAGELWNNPTRAVFSPDGRFILSDNGGDVRLSEVATGREVRLFHGSSSGVFAVAISPDGRRILTQGGRTLRLWDLATGKQLQSFEQNLRGVAITFSSDSRLIASAGHGGFEDLRMRNVVAFSSDGRSVLAAGGWKVTLWNAATGEKLREFGEAGRPDKGDHSLILWDAQTGQELRRFSGHSEKIMSLALSPDGRVAASSSRDNTMRLWEVATGQELRRFEGRTSSLNGPEVTFSADGRTVILAGVSELGGPPTAVVRDVATGNQLRRVELPRLSSTMTFSPDGNLLLMDDKDNVVRLFDMVEQRELRTFTGHKGFVTSLAFLPDRHLAVSGSLDGTVRIWGLREERELARLMAGSADEWLTLTPQGFFSSTFRDTDMLGIVRRLEVTSIGQVHQSLFNPDLVREALAGDAAGEVSRAARIVSLEKVLDSGPPPQAAITSHPDGSRSNTDLVKVTARITDKGKGIGRIEWRVNGVTAGVRSVAQDSGPDYDVEQTLALDPGSNQIEVIAYERLNLLASPPARTTIIFDGTADGAKPKLHILAIGINTYADKGWTQPGSTETVLFPPLNLAVADAKAFAIEMQKAARGLYGDVSITAALDADATAGNLDRLMDLISTQVKPRDTFILYAAAHGISQNGRFYMIPQDFQGGNNPEALAKHAVSQDDLQNWVANRIRAKKALILLDTCESGAVVSGYSKSRTDAPASEAAIGRLHEATGRPVLTAAATGKPAFEGYKGHGVFTYALMDALHNGDSSGNGVIELSELVAHVQELVPKLSASLGGSGGTKSSALIAMRGFKDDKQSAHFGSTGEDFALVRRLQ